MAAIWAGIDAGKTHHHCVAIDENGRRLLSRRVANDEPELLELLADVLALGETVTWGIDLADGGAALAITILFNHAQPVHYISGRAIHRASESYRGEGKTDAKDAAVIADQARIRRDLHLLRAGDETVTDLKILTGRRTDLVADRTRTVNRLRAQLTGIFPGLERALDLTNTGPLVLLTGYQTSASLRRTGKKRIETWLRNRKVLRADRLAETALEAAGRQHTSLPGEKLTAQMVHTLAREVMALNQQVAELDKAIEARFREHRDFEVITSMPGLGVILGAEFLAATGGDMTAFGTADRLAGFGGVAPVPRDSGKISGNLRRPRRYNRRLQRVFYISALFSIRHCDESRRFYERKRAEGKRHIQAVLALARRRVNVLWALLRDGKTDLRGRAAHRSHGLTDRIRNHWAPGRGGVPKTRDNQERRARLHIIPHLGQLPLRNITAADLRAYIAKLESTVSSVDYQRGILSELSSILEAAVDDKRLAGNPMHAKSVRWPKAPQERRDAWPLLTAMRVRDVINPRNRITVVLGLGCGLRQGEVFGLTPQDVDYARGVIHVRRQVQAIKGRLYFALPKGKKTRVVDMPSSVAAELKRHVEAFPPVKVELPWGKPDVEGQRKKFPLLLTTRFGNAIAVNTWNSYTWKPALAKAGVIPPRAEGAKDWQWEAAPTSTCCGTPTPRSCWRRESP